MRCLCKLFVFITLIEQTGAARIVQSALQATGSVEDAASWDECQSRCKPSYASRYSKSCRNGECTIKCNCGDGRSMEFVEGAPSDNAGRQPGRQITTTKPGPKPKPPIASGDFGKKTGAEGWVADHNYFRGLHGAQPVVWDADLAEKAEHWAYKLSKGNTLQHSDCYNTWPYSGENLAWGYGRCASKHYNGNYDLHCATASWYEEYYIWNGVGDWQRKGGIGHFTAMVWKGIDAIGCASAGDYYVCEYGSSMCKTKGVQYGGSQCWWSMPSHLPNFNKGRCSGGACVADRE